MRRPLSLLIAVLSAAIVVLIVVLMQGDADLDRIEDQPTPTATLDPLSSSAFFLEIIEPEASEVVVESALFIITGRTRADAVVSINDLVVDPDVEGLFTATMILDEGPNVIEVVASVGSDEQIDAVLAVIYTP